MQARRIIAASLLSVGLGAAGAAQAQQAADPAAGSQPGYQQPAPEQSQPGASPQQPYQPAPGQPYQQPYQPQPYQQPYQPQPYQPQPYYPPQPYRSPTGATLVPAPRGQARYVNRPRVGLIIAGSVTLGASWLFSTLTASANVGPYYATDYSLGYASTSSAVGDTTALWPLYIPVLGPWIEMGFLHGSGAPLGGALLAFDGLVQAGGLAMLIAGAVTHTRVAVYSQSSLQLSPLSVVGGSGILVSGRF